MRLKLTVLYGLLVLFICLAAYFLLFSVPEPSAPVEEEPEEYARVLEENLEEEVNGHSLDFASLMAENEDFVCWLRIPDTSVNYPVVLGENNSHYLSHSFTGKESGFGCPFVDTRTPPEGDMMMIHGHNMGYNREEMFSSLVLMQDPAYAVSHDKIYLSFPDEEGEREYTIFAVGNFDVTDESFDYYQSVFSTEEDRGAFLSYFAERSLYCSKEPAPEGKILILSTCNNLYGENNRLLLCGVESSSQP